MALEIERKFLIEAIPTWLSEHPSEEIEQGYVTESGDSVQVRLRRRGGESILGVKRGTGLSRGETEVGLDPATAGKLWELTTGRRVQKTRHRVQAGPVTIEVDVYADELEGLVVAEVEFDSEAAASAFDPPGWLGRELTGERRFDNDLLAERGMPEVLG